MQQTTVNVIEMEEDSIVRLLAFECTDEGRQEAKARFTSLVEAHDAEASEADIGDFLDDGYYETGNYQLFLVESTEA